MANSSMPWIPMAGQAGGTVGQESAQWASGGGPQKGLEWTSGAGRSQVATKSILIWDPCEAVGEGSMQILWDSQTQTWGNANSQAHPTRTS